MAAISPKLSQRIEWQWKSNANPWTTSEPSEWIRFSDVENLIIEEAFQKQLPTALLDLVFIHFPKSIQIRRSDTKKRRPIKRFVRDKDDQDQPLRETRFSFDPIAPKRPADDEFGWISPFIIAVRIDLKLKKNQLPSKDPTLIPILVEKAAQGILDEGKQINKEEEAKKIAELLLEKKDRSMREVWKCCAFLHSLESFLYKQINETMRIIGDDSQEPFWRNKVKTLGPFCLLLWDDPFSKTVRKKFQVYRCATLTNEQIATYKEMEENSDEFRSFQTFTSCTRNRQKAEEFGNTLFIMNVEFAFVADISPLTPYRHEEEELITPGVHFMVERVSFDPKTIKYVIQLKLRQRFLSKFFKERCQWWRSFKNYDYHR